MHRTKGLPQIALWSTLLSLTLGSAVPGQEQVVPAPKPATPLAPGLAPQAPPPRAALPPPTLDKAIAAPGAQPVVVPVNGSIRLQMSSKKALRRVVNEKEAVARVVEVQGDPTSVIITGLVPDTTRIVLTDVDGREEAYVVVVQFDVGYLRTLLQQVVPTANVVPIPAANNFIILTGTVSDQEEIDVILKTTQSVVGGPERIINAMRVGGVMQVQLDVIVARVERDERRFMSFEFLNQGQQHILANGMGGLIVPSAGISGTFPGSPTITNTINPVNGQPSNIFFAIFTPKQDFFGFLQLLRDEGLAKILTQPKVVTLSGRPASFLSGGKVPIQSAAGFGVSSVTFEKVGTSVDVLPIVLGNGRIRLEVNPQVQRQGAQLIQGNPTFDTQSVRTVVEIEPGQTLVIGGMIDHQVNGTTRKVPVLGDLPFIGAAFSQKFYQELDSELVILVTPHLVDPMTCDQLPKYLPGQETRTPDDFELFLEGILEAPRGPREVCPNDHYMPAYKNDPTLRVYPCGVGPNAGNGGCGVGGGGCLPAAVNPLAHPITIESRPLPAPALQARPHGVTENTPIPLPVSTAPIEPVQPVAGSEPAPAAAPDGMPQPGSGPAPEPQSTNAPNFSGSDGGIVPK